MGNYIIFQMFENPRVGKQARNFLQQMFRKFQISNRLSNRYFPENCRWVPLLLHERQIIHEFISKEIAAHHQPFISKISKCLSSKRQLFILMDQVNWLNQVRPIKYVVLYLLLKTDVPTTKSKILFKGLLNSSLRS